ncbi:MAG: hypothetical protein EBR34_02965 [Sphingomonadaceae bacterium]|nr:hypothetical protein [Sphingomonadaceae bacterium]
MNASSYPCPLPDGSSADEYALVFDRGLPQRLLIIPALFDEGHRLRRLCVDVMRRLGGSGIDSILPDLPGSNESTADLATLSLADWTSAARTAAGYFGATHVLALRGGGLVAALGLPGWHYGPVKGASLLRTMIRARVLSSREAGREESGEGLLIEAQEHGIELAGYRLGAAMVQQLQAAQPAENLTEIDQELLGGSPLWLRAEPDADAAQADALAAYLTMAIRK